MKSPTFSTAIFTLAWILLVGSSIWYCLLLRAAFSYQEVHTIGNMGECKDPVGFAGFYNFNPLTFGVKVCAQVDKTSIESGPMSAIPPATGEPLAREETPSPAISPIPLSPPPAVLPEAEESAVDPPEPTIPKTTTKTPEEAVPLPEKEEHKVEAEVVKTQEVVEKHEEPVVLPPPPPPLPSTDEAPKFVAVEPPKEKEPKRPDDLPKPTVPIKKVEDPPKEVIPAKEPPAEKDPSEKGSSPKAGELDALGMITGWE